MQKVPCKERQTTETAGRKNPGLQNAEMVVLFERGQILTDLLARLAGKQFLFQ